MVPPLVDRVLGWDEKESTVPPCNALLFAYGQTGTGMTHTTVGPEASVAATPPHSAVDKRWGLFPRVAYALFARLEAKGQPFVVAMSAVEFYLGMATDLMNANTPVALNARRTSCTGCAVWCCVVVRMLSLPWLLPESADTIATPV